MVERFFCLVGLAHMGILVWRWAWWVEGPGSVHGSAVKPIAN